MAKKMRWFYSVVTLTGVSSDLVLHYISIVASSMVLAVLIVCWFLLVWSWCPMLVFWILGGVFIYHICCDCESGKDLKYSSSG